MNLQAFFKFAAVAMLGVTSVQASPFSLDRRFDLKPRDTVVSNQCSDLVVGATKTPDIGSVCVALTSGQLSITYKIDVTGWTFNEVHAWVGTSAPTTTVPGASPGQLPYTVANGKCIINSDKTQVVCTVSPIPSAWRGCDGQLYIVAHADVTGPGSTTSQTAWDNGQCFDSKGNCAKYFKVNRECQCPVEIDYFPVTSTSLSTSIYPSTSTTTYTTSTISTYTTSTTVTFETQSESTTTITSVTSSVIITTPPPTTTTSACADPAAGTRTTTISKEL
ncbi:uncharacterized protein GIQ15_03585 [Arthroderma uncinatum]|uniref:uncharacterized protein n=1 Tax=Arthroderma uncinatum TaxID=74035 RepID=UPI00144A6F71|nr:uncharacterized protein GIQ15_03585 [Arthroderma uncinatum]KAF3484261.1 hypothetical protein GIQ15_03585 [Arthroderma uncinatum]